MILHEWCTSTRREGNMHKQCTTDGNISTYITSTSIRNIGNSRTIIIIYQRFRTVIITTNQWEWDHTSMIQNGWKIHALTIQWRKIVHASMIQNGRYFNKYIHKCEYNKCCQFNHKKMVTITMTIYVTAGKWPNLIVRIRSY